MKTKLLLLGLFLIGFTCYSQNTYVPDDNFEQFLIDSGYDSGSLDDYVPTANINAITFLEIQFLPIADLTGIEDFTALEILRCNYLQITSLDISQNTSLTMLDCIDNELTSLDLSQNTALTYLDCQLNQLTSLDVSQNVLLTNLNCSNNSITSLNLSQNTELTSLSCSFNQLTSLNLSQLSELTFLDCYNNQLTSLDVSQNIELKNLSCYNNQLTNLDVSQNTAILFLYCYNNQLTSLDVGPNNVLSQLNCYDNQLTSLDVSQNSALNYLICYNNQLTSLDLSQNTDLRGLNCESNNLSLLNVKNGNNAAINTFSATGNVNLLCIDVDDVVSATINWHNFIDPQTSFSEDCATFLGVDDEILSEGLKIYPNPVSDILSVESKLALKKIEIYSILGQKVKEINSDFNSISTNQLSNGIFLIKIYSEKGIAVRKLIKQ